MPTLTEYTSYPTSMKESGEPCTCVYGIAHTWRKYQGLQCGHANMHACECMCAFCACIFRLKFPCGVVNRSHEVGALQNDAVRRQSPASKGRKDRKHYVRHGRLCREHLASDSITSYKAEKGCLLAEKHEFKFSKRHMNLIACARCTWLLTSTGANFFD
jgi:hypothetical protein